MTQNGRLGSPLGLGISKRLGISPGGGGKEQSLQDKKQVCLPECFSRQFFCPFFFSPQADVWGPCRDHNLERPTGNYSGALSDDCGDITEPRPLVFLDTPMLLPSSILSG